MDANRRSGDGLGAERTYFRGSRVLHLIKMWLDCPVEETDDRGRKTRTTEARDKRRGIPQGSPLTPRTQKVTFIADPEFAV